MLLFQNLVNLLSIVCKGSSLTSKRGIYTSLFAIIKQTHSFSIRVILWACAVMQQSWEKANFIKLASYIIELKLILEQS